MPETSTVLRWSAYGHEHTPRGADWFWALGIFAVCAALTSILLNNVLFAVLILLAATTLAMIARTPQELSEIEISEKGIRAGDTLHRYNEIISFWVEDEHGNPVLLVDTTKFMSPNLIIPLEDIDPKLVRAYLLEHSKEVHMKEPVGHKILEFFGL